jgi:hypothetical protein
MFWPDTSFFGPVGGADTFSTILTRRCNIVHPYHVLLILLIPSFEVFSE